MYISRFKTPIAAAAAALAVAAVLATGALAGGTGGSATLVAAGGVKNQWSTINICDTAKHQDTVGILARMPSISGGLATMRMRFFAQWMRHGAWVPVPTADGGTTMSGWIKVGSGKFKWNQYGYSFRFAKVKPGQSFTTRGLVKFQWKRHGKIVKGAHAYTSAHHVQGDFGDPKGYSAATCGVSGSS